MARSRGGLSFTAQDLESLVYDAGLEFSKKTNGIWTEQEIAVDGSTRRISLTTGYYRMEAAYYDRTGAHGDAHKLYETELDYMLSPSLDYYGTTGTPTHFAVTKDDVDPILVLNTVPDRGRLVLYYRGRLQWAPLNAGELTDDSVPVLLEEYHIGIAHRTAAYIAENASEWKTMEDQLEAFENVVNAYASMVNARAGSTGIERYRPRPFGRHGRAGLIGRAPGPTTGGGTMDTGTWYVAVKASSDFTAADFTAAGSSESGTGESIQIPTWPAGERFVAMARRSALPDPTFTGIGSSGHQDIFGKQAGEIVVGGETCDWWLIYAAQSRVLGGQLLVVR